MIEHRRTALSMSAISWSFDVTRRGRQQRAAAASRKRGRKRQAGRLMSVSRAAVHSEPIAFHKAIRILIIVVPNTSPPRHTALLHRIFVRRRYRKNRQIDKRIAALMRPNNWALRKQQDMVSSTVEHRSAEPAA